ncbi:MAG TPA: AI-2E family transporter, partial [Ktedonobacterales bacterium]|nr:AI-2E family transporter [Ktedonobacterales bacterium]
MSRDILDRHRSLRILIGLLCVAVGIYIVSAVWSVVVVLSNVILLFLLAWIVSFVLEPVAILLRQRGLPRVAAVSLIYFALLIVVSGAIVLAVPSIEGQIKLLSGEITSTFSATNLPILSKNAEEVLRHMGFSQRDAHNIVGQLSAQLPNWTSQLTNGAVTMATTAVASLLTIIVDMLLVVILSYYIMLDGTRLVEAGIAKLPPSWVGDVRLFQRYARDIFGGFFRA